jgi:hypothetical protein
MKLKIIIWYAITTLILAYFLYGQIKKFILAIRVNRGEKNLGRSHTQDELSRIERGTWPVALLISFLFSIFFNKFLIGRLLMIAQ